MDDLTQLEEWAGGLLAKLQPAERRRLARDVGRKLHRSQQMRIARQLNPDGTKFEPRKPQKDLRAKAGRVKRGVMFYKLRQSRHLKMRSSENEITVGFFGRVARIAEVHQDGRTDTVQPSGKTVRYPIRQLIGFTQADRELIRDALIDHLAR